MNFVLALLHGSQETDSRGEKLVFVVSMLSAARTDHQPVESRVICAELVHRSLNGTSIVAASWRKKSRMASNFVNVVWAVTSCRAPASTAAFQAWDSPSGSNGE